MRFAPDRVLWLAVAMAEPFETKADFEQRIHHLEVRLDQLGPLSHVPSDDDEERSVLANELIDVRWRIKYFDT